MLPVDHHIRLNMELSQGINPVEILLVRAVVVGQDIAGNDLSAPALHMFLAEFELAPQIIIRIVPSEVDHLPADIVQALALLPGHQADIKTLCEIHIGSAAGKRFKVKAPVLACSDVRIKETDVFLPVPEFIQGRECVNFPPLHGFRMTKAAPSGAAFREESVCSVLDTIQ